MSAHRASFTVLTVTFAVLLAASSTGCSIIPYGTTTQNGRIDCRGVRDVRRLDRGIAITLGVVTTGMYAIAIGQHLADEPGVPDNDTDSFVTDGTLVSKLATVVLVPTLVYGIGALVGSHKVESCERQQRIAAPPIALPAAPR